MKLSTFSSRLSALLLLLAGCTQSEPLPGDDSSGVSARTLLQIGTLQTATGDEGGTVTRVENTTDYPSDKEIGFFVKEDATNGYQAKNNIKGTCNGTSNLWLPAEEIWLNQANATVAVYAPYDINRHNVSGSLAAEALRLTAGLRPGDGSKDIWYKRTTANNIDSRLDLTLEHAYTRLTLNVTKDASLPEAQITALEVAGTDISATATLSPLEDTPYTPGAKKGITPAVASQTIDNSQPSAGYDLLLIPSALTDDFSVTFTVNGNKMRLTLSPTQFTGSKLEAGKQYKVEAKLVPGKLEVISVTVANWENAVSEPDGTTSYDPPAPVDYIDIGLSFYIAPGNVMVTKNAAGAYVYSFAREQGYCSVDGSTDTFYWGTLDPAATAPANTWSDANDVCAKVGTGWRTPGKDEMESLIGLDKCLGTWKKNDGRTVSGSYFGTAVQPAEEDRYEYVFLPELYFFLNESGTYGYYWSQTGSSPYAYILLYFAGYCFMTNVSTTDESARYPVRCIKNK